MEARQHLYRFLKSEVVGPLIDEEGNAVQSISTSPTEQFSAGLVFPQGTPLPDEINEDSSVVPDESVESIPLQTNIAVESGRFYPSAIGITFIVAAECNLSITITWATYAREGRVWRRSEHSKQQAFQVLGGGFSQETLAISENVSMSFLTRRVRGGIAVTASLLNSTKYQDLASRSDGPLSRTIITENTLYEAGILVTPSKQLSAQHQGPALGASDEDQELSFQYRNIRTYAIGHGVSACWDVAKNQVWTEAVPAVLVPGLSFESPDHLSLSEELSLSFLANSDKPIESLERIAARYQDWIQRQEVSIEQETLSKTQLNTAQEITSKQKQALMRLRVGIKRLSDDRFALQSFRIANKILLRQMNRNSKLQPIPERKWRVFQICFALIVIGDLNQPVEQIQSADLLWFPTGGGKTEAYLFLVAYEMVYRRLANDGNDEGVVALSRYSLRLLTSQQFQRAAALMVAAELVRAELPELGKKEFHVGLHVGQDAAPRDIAAVEEKFAPKWRSGEAELPIPFCVWCSQRYEIFEEQKNPRNSLLIVGSEVILKCRNEDCEFADKRLPVNFLQASVRRSKPSMVIATLDSFASLPTWSQDEIGMLGGSDAPAPSLIIQDELHLLTGPLGTADALYEAALEALLTLGGKRPKIVASTATIKHASQQSQLLYGKKIEVFPPPGITPNDNFFSVTTEEQASSRLYVGVMSVGASWQTTAVRTMATLAQGPTQLPGTERDPYWTQVLYVSTTRTHGRVTGLLRDDVRARVYSRYGTSARQLPEHSIVELRGDNDASQLVATLERLQAKYPSKEAISALVTTSVIQVGVDIPRLGLIAFVGQPYSTSEYIQASSRVGRISAAPGLVVTMFNHGKSRDRSYYESFKAYHDSLYRWVEPVSITPFSVNALERYLPAVLAAVARFGVKSDCSSNPLQAIRDGGSAWKARDFLLERIKDLPAADIDQLRSTLDQLLRLWSEWANAGAAQGLSYEWTGRGEGLSCLISFSNGSLWKIAGSLRDVEAKIGFKPLESENMQ